MWLAQSPLLVQLLRHYLPPHKYMYMHIDTETLLTFHMDGDCSSAGAEIICGRAVIDASMAPVNLCLLFYIISNALFEASQRRSWIPLSQAVEHLLCSLYPCMVAGTRQLIHFWHICNVQREHTHWLRLFSLWMRNKGGYLRLEKNIGVTVGILLVKPGVRLI